MTAPALPIPGLSRQGPLHWHSGWSPGHVTRAFLLATVPIVAAGLVLFGRAAAGVLCCSILGAVLGELLVFYITPQGPRRKLGFAALTGILLGLTLPVTVPWHIPFLGGLVAVAVGQGLLGGFGNYLWQPALVGWAVLHLVFGAQLAPRTWPVLAAHRLWSGSIQAAAEVAYYRGYQWTRPPYGVDAWALQRPIDLLILNYGSSLGEGGVSEAGWLELFRDRLPPWRDTLWGTVGGGIGETCTLALALGGLYLTYRGLPRWRAVTAALLTVAMLAAVLPIRLDDRLLWLPVFSFPEQFPAGPAWVLFHLTGDGLLLSCLILAADPMTTPLMPRGNILFGVGVGVLTMTARWFGLTPGSSYWAILAMNALVPVIDRFTRRRGRGAAWRWLLQSRQPP
ncbi:MAG: RnfABCDGE type electron transport complex subunit D [Planctomycetota bacterium]